jgi:hypothetical protein
VIPEFSARVKSLWTKNFTFSEAEDWSRPSGISSNAEEKNVARNEGDVYPWVMEDPAFMGIRPSNFSENGTLSATELDLCV